LQKIKAIEFIKPLLLLVVVGYAEARGIIEQRVNVENLKSKMLETKKWLKVRAGVYNKYSTLPSICEPLSIRITPPKAGWIEVLFQVRDREYKVVLSSYPEPFIDIKRWLERVVVNTELLDYTLNLDCDGTYNTIFHYEMLPVPNDEKGIFYLYDSTETECLDGYVRKKDLIRAIYNGILDYARTHEQESEFQENWMEYMIEEDYPSGKLSSDFRSVVIEEYLKE
jgi:hypothetical protein